MVGGSHRVVDDAVDGPRREAKETRENFRAAVDKETGSCMVVMATLRPSIRCALPNSGKAP